LEEDKELRLVILEIGCGISVQTVRWETEGYIREIDNGQCTLIRVNMDHPESFINDNDPNIERLRSLVISIKGKGLETLKHIDLLRPIT
jgi:hypothetical protein